MKMVMGVVGGKRWVGVYKVAAAVGGCVHSHKQGSGLQAKIQNRGTRAWFGECHWKWQWGQMGGGGRLWCMWWLQWFGWLFYGTSGGQAFGANNPKLSHQGLVSGVPCETVVENGGEGWWSGVDGVVVIVWMSSWNHEWGKGFRPKKQNQAMVAQFRACHVKR